MKFTLPLYHEKFTENGAVRYFVRPLFHETPDACREDLRRATDSVANALRRDLAALARKPRQDDLAAMVFSPELNEQTARVSIALRRRTFEAEYLLVSWEAMGRRLCMTPRLPGLWFALERGQDAASRAGEVLSAYYRSLERQGLDTDPTLHAPRGSAWITHQELDIALDHSLPDERAEGRAAIGAYESLPGDEELHRVGRLVNALYPEALVRAVQRDAEVADLTRLLAAADRRPLLLLGPSGAGKTAVLHEHVRRTMEPGQRRSAPQQVWQVAPQRLISGMSYVGQWENRLHAILAEVRRRDHVLYFDDFLGLFRAGQSAGSRLSVAQVLRPFAERREVRVLAEMTPQAFRVLAEQDRGWSDLFHVIPVREQPEEEALRVVLHGRRNLEASHECRLDVEAVATAVELQQRYRRDTAMPGKALGFLGQVAARHRGEAVSRDDVLREFEAQSGLSVTFLDQRRKLERDEVLAGLRRGVLGQEAALQAVADAIVVARARLNDPERPLGSFLFLGPTGTGKTHCAKALARWLYGSEEALLRFDLNEFQSPHAVARLAGSFDEPEGLLTSAVRRRPFSVLLFDEVEKAHPAAHDLLLQVLGEGRLTDALGRTADFCNTMIVLTSNMGAEQAHQAMGFGRHAEPGAEAYVAAARKFFRPEFFNRLDRIVPFARLPREQVGEIARGLLAGLLRREGLGRRLCILHVDDGALQRVVDEGFHPQLGARAVRRALEQAFTVPLARHLAALRAEVPTVIRLSGEARAVTVAVQPLAPAMAAAPAAAALDYSDPHGVIAAVDAVV
ncbi:MAG: ATP-dependent Clp protease ATP-binding subunit, partial [Planctomycetes bacterium]|nr:ATP-dependent Clp protease ATP-binding subunit [Planctomycetota bacterium]